MSTRVLTLSSILSLLLGCGPSTVVRLVVAVVVDTIKRIPFRSFSHVLIKIFKRFKPAFANLNSTPSIVLVITVSWICTALFHASPNLILANMVQSVLCYFQKVETATAPRVSISETATINYQRITAIAQTFPVVTPPDSMGFDSSGFTDKPNNVQHSESECRKIEARSGWIKSERDGRSLVRMRNRHQFFLRKSWC